MLTTPIEMTVGQFTLHITAHPLNPSAAALFIETENGGYPAMYPNTSRTADDWHRILSPMDERDVRLLAYEAAAVAAKIAAGSSAAYALSYQEADDINCGEAEGDEERVHAFDCFALGGATRDEIEQSLRDQYFDAS